MTPADEWARCKGWIETARIRAIFPEPIEAIEAKLASDAYQLWPGENSAAITEVAFFKDRKVMIVKYCGGDLAELMAKIEPALCVVAKAMGCTMMMNEGREGWKKPATNAGYKLAWITMFKEL